jgi:hypothetical protein
MIFARLNKEHLAEVRDRIIADPEHFDMGCWIEVRGVRVTGPSGLGHFECRTTACIAGHAALAAGTSSLAEAKAIKATACRYLGLNKKQAWRLFYYRWPDRFLGRDESQAKRAIDLLDAMISGEVTLSRRGQWTDRFAGDVSPSSDAAAEAAADEAFDGLLRDLEDAT